jgi:hypothetical protein
MDWEAIGALGEAVSAILVLVTLIYLATQVRYAKNAAADANRLMRARGVCDFQLACATNDSLSQINSAGNDSGSWYEELSAALGITAEEAMRLDALSLYWIWLHWGQYSSTNNKDDLDELGDTIGMFYSSSRAIKYSWENGPFTKPLLSSKFVEFVDSNMQKFDAEK